MYGPALDILAPQPLAPRYGLVAQVLAELAATVGDVGDAWQNGVRLVSYPAGLPVAYDPCATGSQAGNLPSGVPAVPAVPEFSAFVVSFAAKCSALGMANDEDYARRVQRAFEARESWLVEREFEQGAELGSAVVDTGQGFLARTDQPGGAKPHPLTLANAGLAAVNPTQALALLETAISNTGQAGVLHASPEVATYWAGANLIADDKGTMRTIANGTVVIVGAGYQGVAPSGQTANTTAQVCAYATGPVLLTRELGVRLSPATLAEALDRSNNDVTVRAERTYLVAWDEQFRAVARITKP